MPSKKVLPCISGCALLFTSNVFSDTGPYVGFDLGWGVARTQSEETPKTPSANNPPYSANTGYAGPLAGIHAGYGFDLFNQLYLGTELFYTWSNIAFSDTNIDNLTTGDFTVKQNSAVDRLYGMSLLPGYRPNRDTLLYARLGYVRARLYSKDSSTPSAGSSDDVPVFKRDISGYQLGLGTQLRLTKALFWRMEYNYMRFKKFSVPGSYPDPTHSYIYTTYPTLDQFSTGLNYLFGAPAEAGSDTRAALSMPGFYAGVAGGRDVGRIYLTQNLQFANGDGTLTYKTYAHYQGYTADAHLGYNFLIPHSHFYLGTELFTDISSAFGSIPFGSIGTMGKLKKYYGIGASILPGYRVTPNDLVYLRLGVVQSRFGIELSTEEASITAPDSSNRKTLPGAQLGLGYEFGVTSSLGIRTEYKYTIYRATYIPAVTSNIAGGTNRVNITDNLFTIGLNYHFG